jgi:hypothetical protein
MNDEARMSKFETNARKTLVLAEPRMYIRGFFSSFRHWDFVIGHSFEASNSGIRVSR